MIVILLRYIFSSLQRFLFVKSEEGGESIIAKSSWSSTSNTALMDILRVSGIDTILVCGLITSVCVQHSAFGVFEAGYRTLLVEDSCGDRGRARHDAALALYGGYMYELISSTELADPVNGLQKAKPVWITLQDINSTGPKSKGRRDRSASTASAAEISVGVETGTIRKRIASYEEGTDEGSADVDYSRPSKKKVPILSIDKSSSFSSLAE
jgi:maleamate amidohydrolase